MSNKDLNKTLAAAGALIVFLSAILFHSSSHAGDQYDGSKDASITAASFSIGSFAEGKALLKAEDLKTLLSQSNTQVGSAFDIQVSKHDIQVLVMKLDSIAAERAALVTKIEKANAEKKQEIRSRRRNIQTSRIGAQQSAEQKLAKSLYENLLEESNLESQMKRELESFDRAHTVSLNFVQLKGQRVVQNISFGEHKVWSSRSTFNIAATK